MNVKHLVSLDWTAEAPYPKDEVSRVCCQTFRQEVYGALYLEVNRRLCNLLYNHLREQLSEAWLYVFDVRT